MLSMIFSSGWFWCSHNSLYINNLRLETEVQCTFASAVQPHLHIFVSLYVLLLTPLHRLHYLWDSKCSSVSLPPLLSSIKQQINHLMRRVELDNGPEWSHICCMLMVYAMKLIARLKLVSLHFIHFLLYLWSVSSLFHSHLLTLCHWGTLDSIFPWFFIYIALKNMLIDLCCCSNQLEYLR